MFVSTNMQEVYSYVSKWYACFPCETKQARIYKLGPLTSADLCAAITVKVTSHRHPPSSYELPPTSRLPVCIPHCRLCECTEAEAEIVLQLKNELREKELKLTDIRLEALSSAHHLDQIREAMNRMQVSSINFTYSALFSCDKVVEKISL